MTRHGPDDPQLRAAWRRARRRVARDHHPDVGGDLDAYLASVAQVDARYAVGPSRRLAGGRVELRRTPWTLVRRSLRRRLRRTRRHVRSFRTRLPRRAPGALRYTDLS